MNDALATYAGHHKAKLVENGFRYSSGTNTDWLSVGQLRDLIRRHVDPAFTV
jgi:hypothetical protein